jgi:outer membrane lipoprotein-sorting protein
VLETVTYDGVSCKVLMIQKSDGKGETKMWIREDYGIPVRIENNDAGISTIIEYKNLKVGSVPAEMFQLPAEVQVLTQGG